MPATAIHADAMAAAARAALRRRRRRSAGDGCGAPGEHQHEPAELGPGDLVTFAADVPHVYEALETTHAVLLMSYP
jgi:hypothetical protein